MNLSDIRFPRQLEADETAETIRKALMARTVKLWPGGDLDVARITMNDPLKKVLRKARLMRGNSKFGDIILINCNVGIRSRFLAKSGHAARPLPDQSHDLFDNRFGVLLSPEIHCQLFRLNDDYSRHLLDPVQDESLFQ